jgi:hypothetical protein
MNFLFVCRFAIMHTRRRKQLPSFGKGRVMAVAVSRRPLTAKARDKSQNSPREICGGSSMTGTTIPPIIVLSFNSIIPPVLHIYCHSSAFDARGGAVG